jgi:hypothetical protein
MSRIAASSTKPSLAASADRLIKVSADGQLLPHDAPEWEGIYLPAASLIVARRLTAKALGFKAANAACTKIDLCGAPGERSISLREFVNHLLEDDRTGPAIDAAFFTIDDPYQWIWTCDECAPSGCAWYVDLGGGYSGRGSQGNRARALAVRSGQFSGFGEAA